MNQALILNAGSSSLKWAVLDFEGEIKARGNERWRSEGARAQAEQIKDVLHRAPSFDVVGHRFVHGGLRFRAPARLDADARAALHELLPLDPLHMTPALAGLSAVTQAFPTAPQVASFDTAFHAQMPRAAAGYALPSGWSERWGLVRFGFHGLSVSHAVERVGELLGGVPPRLVVCHLGGGCSVTAVDKGRSSDTSMGFSPLEGMMMGTRCGSVDPGLLLFLLRRCDVTPGELEDALTNRSGLLGVSGVSSDLREVRAAALEGSAPARLACDRFALSLRRSVGAMVAVLGGVDAIVFTGGIGENDAEVREDTAAALAFAGLELDAVRNRQGRGDREISSEETLVRAFVIEAREDLAVLHDVRTLTEASASAD
ncbi:MAG: acetate/propionate family kinase [Myxococcales bacterium]|nr:acetate/propionate family kinase [Myxococcales bacterium]